jgi:hypothetical protein
MSENEERLLKCLDKMQVRPATAWRSPASHVARCSVPLAGLVLSRCLTNESVCHRAGQAQLSALETEGLKADLQQLRDEIKGISGGCASGRARVHSGAPGRLAAT